MPVTAEELIKATTVDFPAIADKHGITPDSLVKLLKTELQAKETKFIKFKGQPYSLDELILMADEAVIKKAVEGGGKNAKELQKILELKKKKLPKQPFKLICQSGDESVIAVDMQSLSIMQAARIDAMRLFGMYKADNEQKAPPFVWMGNTGKLRKPPPKDWKPPKKPAKKKPGGKKK